LLEYNYIIIPPPNEFCECIISCGRMCKKSSQALSIFALKTQNMCGPTWKKMRSRVWKAHNMDKRWEISYKLGTILLSQLK
jgi:hypothetical protein